MFLRKWLCFLVLAIAIALGGGLVAYLYLHPPFQRHSQAACIGTPESYSFTLKPTFFLNKRFLPQRALTADELRAYVDVHLRFIQTTLPSYSSLETPKFSSIPAKGYKISNVQSHNTTYPLALSINANELSPVVIDKIKAKKNDLEAQYLVQAIAVGQTTSDDEALRITYDADINVVLCASADHKFSETVHLPADPLLGLWFVPESKRIEQMNEALQVVERVTPCATSDLIYDHDPYYYWYYWSLNHPECRKSLTPQSVMAFPVENKKTISLETDKSFDLSFLRGKSSKPLKITVNFTMIDDDSVFVPEPLSPTLGSQIDQVLALPTLEEARGALNNFTRYDIALRSGLVFAWSLKRMSDEFKLEQVTLENMLAQWKIHGRLRESQKNYEIFVTIGSAMSEMPSYEKFYAALNEGIATSDIVYYGGHSGVGKNLSENRVHEKVVSLYSSLPAEKIPAHQLIVLMTCYSLHYFPIQSFPMPSQNFTRDILFTASTPSGYDARMLTGLMEQIDRYLSKGRHLPYEKWPAYYNADVLLVHETQLQTGFTSEPSGKR